MAITYKAILVGNSIFPEDPHGLPDLKGPTHDVQALEAALSHPEKGLFRKENIQTLVNKSSQEILYALEHFYGEASRSDQLLFYYSGHGCKNLYDQLYLCGSNSIQERLVSTAISDMQINSLLDLCSSKKKIIILDCCNSGNFKSGHLPQSLQGEGRFVITSSNTNVLTEDSTEEGSPSPFTKYFVEALLDESVNTNKDGFVSINEVYFHLYPKLNAATKQRPQRKFSDTVGDLPLSKRNHVVLPSPNTEQEHKTINLGTGKPKLNVSEQHIHLRAVGFKEELSPEVIDVFNEGSGELDWEASTENAWIHLDVHDTYFTAKLTPPKVGMNRGVINVRDKNSGGSKTIRIDVERLAQAKQQPKVAAAVPSESPGPNDEKSVLLVTFDNVTMRHPSQATATVDNSEQKGKLLIFNNRIEFRGSVRQVIKNIESMGYYPQEVNTNNTFNYMGITGDYEGTKQEMYFYTFSWFGAGQTWKMIEQIYDFVVKKRLKVSPNFTSHMERDSQLQHPSPTAVNPTPPPQQQHLRVNMPGTWNIYVYQFGQQISHLNLNFVVGGVIYGTQQSVDGFSNVKGNWGFNPSNNVLTYNVMVHFVTGSVADAGSVQLFIDQAGRLSGTDHLGRQWVLQRL
ncbi:MAG: caspase family protein [Saprospiraceae bacterium]|nr:caspase family protein [Saprospiraceae bacterium]